MYAVSRHDAGGKMRQIGDVAVLATEHYVAQDGQFCMNSRRSIDHANHGHVDVEVIVD